ncbi:conserved hypothetical protein [Beutenbergia cavernae DSM 12333]|uniref:Polymerase nucleotidyl transferase domain-containing protein n=1 Tax=Beutenbergia cavernae (strain ATCC BAA-8 / DSM 12333 / CCUG 43141 / JCM 11478 / NBRC 16432 / NCIMB 13614 / HKI 0122) TaxID=471853 RepID=C5C3T4_BEUC1|nr:nucleotidyltransferase domain-containing protein [Beutenbergia cavernae]ACQ81993.1 conserved hypothetical protein [Beutenbergia cavernae DSM 12333]
MNTDREADDEAFLGGVADRLAALPGVRAVTLGGSRAEGTHAPESDWDLAVHYRGSFDPQDLRDVGWRGEVSELGGWGGGIFNGGAWLEIDDRRVDVHYRDLAVTERVLADARDGRFAVEPLMFHLAGIPTYLLLAELAQAQVLREREPLPRPEYPEALRREAPREWWGRAEVTFGYALDGHARRGRVTQAVGLAAVATAQAAHAVVAARGVWVTNDKQLLARAGLEGVDELLGAPGRTPEELAATVTRCRELCGERAAVR